MTPLSWPAVADIAPPGAEIAVIDPRVCDPRSLPTAEQTEAASAPWGRRQEHAAGRIGARSGLARLGCPEQALLSSTDGSPRWPVSVRGSISHKSELCVVVVASDEVWSGVGVDVEHTRVLPASVWPAVLTCAERENWPPRELAGAARLVFSAKEAYYKWYRSSGYAGQPTFHDVEVRVSGDRVRVVPVSGAVLPAVGGRCLVTRDWIVVLLWEECSMA